MYCIISHISLQIFICSTVPGMVNLYRLIAMHLYDVTYDCCLGNLHSKQVNLAGKHRKTSMAELPALIVDNTVYWTLDITGIMFREIPS